MHEFLPNIENAEIPEAKILEYLLSATHPTGKTKAAFFFKYGFTIDHFGALVTALLEHGSNHPISRAIESSRGTRYIIEGSLTTPDGRHPNLRSVWFIETGEQHPRLVTAYPLQPRKK